jgi:hypothetical protein
MFQKIKEFLFGKLPAEQTPSAPVEAVPYKVEAPAPVAPIPADTAPKCGCGRSPSGLCVGLHKLSADEWAVHADNPSKVGKPADDRVEATAPTKPASKPRAKPAAAAKKPAAIKAAPRKAAPRKPAAK